MPNLRVDGLAPSVGITLNTNGNMFSKLKPGDTFRAQVLENTGNDLSLKLSDGSMVHANAMTPVDAKDGEYVNFTFKGIMDGKPALEVASRNMQPQVDTALDNIKNTLAGLNLPITDQNIELAQALQRQNIPVSTDNMSKMMNLISNNVELKPDSAAFLIASNMSDNQNSIENLQNLLAGRLKISNDIGDLLRLIGNGSKSATEAINLTTINSILEKLVNKMNLNGQNQASNGIPANNTAVAQSGTLNNSTNASTTNNANLSAMATNNTNNVTTNTSANIVLNTSTADSTANNPVNTNTTQANTLPNDTNIDAKNNVNTDNSRTQNNVNTDNNKTQNNVNANNSKPQNNIPTSASNNNVINNNTVNSSLRSDTSYIEQQISNLLKGGVPLGKDDLAMLKSISSQLESLINNGKISTEELSATKLIAKEIDVAIFKIQMGEEASDQMSSAAKAIKNFEESVNKLQDLFVKIDQNSDEINPIKLYKNMDEALQTLKTSIQHLPVDMQKTAMNIVNNLENNVNFINQLNNYSSYIQIPLSIFNQNTTGQLFMLKKGSKSKKLDPSNMSVLISLDTSNIGRIDTLLSVDKKNISTNFRLENSEVFDILKENHKMLYTSLLEKGYRLVDFTYRLMEEPLSIVNFEEEAKKEFIKSSNNINVLI